MEDEMLPKDVEKALAEHYFEVPPHVQRMAQRATFDLYYGPIGTEHDYEDDEPYPGFGGACDIVRGWCNDNLSDGWYDSQSGEVLDREPEGFRDECYECNGTGKLGDDPEEDACPKCDGEGWWWQEPLWEDYFEVKVKDAKRALFGKELAGYL